ncbi:hypothetical protein [Brevibacillus sp. AY1]|uniref:hypothetical protein n=1 Tax=Brevibacillus sp. AY1 TaxID=2807621 RepID=UPI002457841B|nr:hypothetical protein [Brevibacillus sp. AY1]MDH4620111.1 hypothetical protein [Brevibacillus sp. AY1]
MKPKKRNIRKPIKVVAHYMMINGKKVEIDPFQTDLPDRCKLFLAEITTGFTYRLGEQSVKSETELGN